MFVSRLQNIPITFPVKKKAGFIHTSCALLIPYEKLHVRLVKLHQPPWILPHFTIPRQITPYLTFPHAAHAPTFNLNSSGIPNHVGAPLVRFFLTSLSKAFFCIPHKPNSWPSELSQFCCRKPGRTLYNIYIYILMCIYIYIHIPSYPTIFQYILIISPLNIYFSTNIKYRNYNIYIYTDICIYTLCVLPKDISQ